MSYMQYTYQAMRISIHALFAEGDTSIRIPATRMWISIHALFAEGDGKCAARATGTNNFYPRPLRRGRPKRDQDGMLPSKISIHALFAEGDQMFRLCIA